MIHPYETLPSYCFWSRTISHVVPSEVDPVVLAKFSLLSEDRVVTAGSCFAQHIARHLAAKHFNHFVTETVHPMLVQTPNEHNYGLFSARYGNIYTSRQLLQLLKRAYGLFVPAEDVWRREDGGIVDPFRPRIQPKGFSCIEEFIADRQKHFSAIRRAIEEMDVFIFTLGLTEGWVARIDGAAFPLCPGVAGGTFNAEQHMFHNLKVADVVADLSEAYNLIREKNPNVRLILTVSPVPLAATMENRSVLVSTTYSKSVLRVAAEELASSNDKIAYFPSYEIITGSYSRGSYFGEDLRAVTEAGVSHVMDLFMKHYASNSDAPDSTAMQQTGADLIAPTHHRKMETMVTVMCDEELLDAGSSLK
jgi:hypothetical protein